MKITRKLPLAFALALGCLFAGALFGIYRLNLAVSLFKDDVLQHVAGNKTGAEISTAFSTAVQEWKNVLLRGKDPKALDSHWAAHQRDMGRVEELLGVLDKQVDADSPARPLVGKLQAEMRTVSAAYIAALEAYKASGQDYAAGDRAARGKDRAAAETLAELRQALSKQEQDATQDATAGARLATTLALGVMLFVAATSLAGAIWMSRQITKPLVQAVDIAQRVSDGMLDNAIVVSQRDEVGTLLTALARMQQKLGTLVHNVRQGAEGVATASAQIASGNGDLSSRTESQASALQQTAAAMDQLNSTVQHNAQNARAANQLAQGASAVAEKGGELVGQVVTTMQEISDSSRRIADIIGVIDGIAFQTNILALNAAVEAARAGEQGRGFAVVASEVRSLAQRSAEAAREIKDLILASVERVERGTGQVDEAGSTMSNVVDAIRRVTEIVAEISSASAEQASGVSQVGDAVTQMDQATQQNAALVEEMAAAAISMKSQSAELLQSVSAFKVVVSA